MRTLSALVIALALAGCAATLPAVIVTGQNTFEVRYDQNQQSVAEVDARAARQCGGEATFVSGETRFDGFAYRSYRCGRQSVAGPETVPVLVGADADAMAQRACGGPARPESVHHETNVITYRCLRAS